MRDPRVHWELLTFPSEQYVCITNLPRGQVQRLYGDTQTAKPSQPPLENKALPWSFATTLAECLVDVLSPNIRPSQEPEVQHAIADLLEDMP